MSISKNIQILLIDNTSIIRKMVKGLLKDLGFDRVLDSDSKSHAFEVIKNSTVDLIITEWNTPQDKDFFQALRNDAKHKNLPVIIIGSEAKREQIIEAASLGINGYLITPISGAILQEKIEKIFKNKVK
jgi:two-component system chemotaxis response regulator CheY